MGTQTIYLPSKQWRYVASLVADNEEIENESQAVQLIIKEHESYDL
jgi:hypothetical protein